MRKTGNRSRREFLSHLASVGVAGLFASRFDHDDGSRRAARGNDAARLDELRPEDFAKHIGQAFAIHDGDRRMEAELVRVERCPRGRALGEQREPFSVIFRLPGGEPVPHQIYTINHALMGRFDLFLGAVGPPSLSSAQLEAVFA